GVAIVAVLGMATLWGMNSARVEEGQPRAAQQAVPVPQPAVVPGTPGPQAVPAPPPPTAQLADPAPSPVFASEPQAVTGPATNPYNTPTVVFDASSLPPEISGVEGVAGTGNSASDFASRIG
ncbi:type VI secretion protein, partial [Altererythrobacter salegens]|nr:type VI secretion protein [Croceibacterium salegens]